MFEKAFEPAKRFLGVIGASVGGLTAIFYVVGFLAVQAHHSFLGLTHISVDFNQYLFAGGLFFAYLPTLVIFLFKSAFTILAVHFEWLLYAVAAIVAVRLLLLFKLTRRLVGSIGSAARTLAIRHVTALQIAFNLIFLWLFLTFSLEIVEESNWLFRTADSASSWLIANTAEASGLRQEYFAWLLLIAILSISALALLEYWRLQPNSKTGEPTKAPWRSVLSISAFALVMLEVLYLPVNYGMLLISNSYPTAEVGLRNNQLDDHAPSGQPLILLHREGDDYYFYNRENKKIWQIRRADLAWLSRTGEVNVFEEHVVHTYKGGEN